MDSPHDHFRRVVADTGDRIAAIRAIRERFGLDLRQAKEVMLQAEGTAASLAEHEERIAAVLLDNRKPTSGQVFLVGAILGASCFLLAESLVPREVSSPGEHDLFLANRLGLLFTPLVGTWLGWLQRSWLRALFGAMLGILIGLLYLILCGRNFLAVMVAFPCLLGGVFAMLAGSNREPWFENLGVRLGKGLVAGFVLGLVYAVALNVVGAGFLPHFRITGDFTSRYVSMMWKAGPVALGLAGGLFLILMRWAVGLTRVRFILFEDVPSANVRFEEKSIEPEASADQPREHGSSSQDVKPA